MESSTTTLLAQAGGVERSFGIGLLIASRWWGMGSSTLLGPEGSAVVLLFWLGFALVGVVVGGWASVPPFAFSCPVGCVGVLVGLLFEICIVDASIFTARPSRGGVVSV